MWKSSKLTDGRKSKDPVVGSRSSFTLGAIDPKLNREVLLIEAPLERESWAPFRPDARVEFVDELATLSLGMLL